MKLKNTLIISYTLLINYLIISLTNICLLFIHEKIHVCLFNKHELLMIVLKHNSRNLIAQIPTTLSVVACLKVEPKCFISLINMIWRLFPSQNMNIVRNKGKNNNRFLVLFVEALMLSNIAINHTVLTLHT
jgi:hypothetical protein